MVGYRDARYGRFGTAAARLDDALAWVPARATAVLVALARPGPGRRRCAAHGAAPTPAAHPSPNAGVAEAAFAAALGLRLGGGQPLRRRGREPPALGAGRAPRPPTSPPRSTLSRDVTWLLAGLLGRRRAAPASPAAAGGAR